MRQETINTVVEQIVNIMVQSDLSAAEAVAVAQALNDAVQEVADETGSTSDIILP